MDVASVTVCGDTAEVYITVTDLEEDRVVIRLELSREALRDRTLWYGYGHNFACNITDDLGRAIPSFGPIHLKDWIK